MIKSLKLKYPNAQIIFLTANKNYSLIKLFPFIDSIITINEKNAIQIILTSLKLIKYLVLYRTNIFIDLEIYSFYSKILSALSFSDTNIGFYRNARPHRGIYTNPVYFDINSPVKNVYLEAARITGCSFLSEDLYGFDELIHNEEFRQIQYKNGIVAKSGCDDLINIKNFIVINPNASDLRIERRWPAENFITLTNQLLEKYPEIKIVLTGSLDEKDFVDRIYEKINEKHHPNVINTAGTLSLGDFIMIIHKCRLIITNDTGPMHIAIALKKKIIALFGPCSPAGYLSQPNLNIVYRKIHCSPCVHDFSIAPCKGDNQCMKLIGVKEIIDIFNRIIEVPVNQSQYSKIST
jgi:ADP-heptose:LPS heptosyltransferase